MSPLTPLLSERAAARFLSISVRSLQRLREVGSGPAYYQVSAGTRKPRVAYSPEELARWLESRRRTSTSESGSLPSR